MAVDTTTGSPGWWLLRLLDKLEARRSRYELLHRYQVGDHRLPEGDERCREVFRRFQRKARTNYTGLVAESVRERLHVTGFRTGGQSTDEADSEAWRIWQANHLDADSGMVHLAALTFSDAYVIVGAGEGNAPLITPEDPREVITEHDPTNRRRIRAALKTWVDEAQNQRQAVVYLPGGVHYFVAPLEQHQKGRPREAQWSPDPDTEDTGNPVGEVPVVRFVNRPQLGGDGLGEFEDVIDVQDRLNNSLLDRLVITKMQAYRQRYAKGIQTEDDDGNPLDQPFVPGSDLLWVTQNPDAEFGSFQESDIRQLLEAIRHDVQDLAAVSRTPPHYLLGEIVNVSGDALTAAETGLMSKSRERMRHYGESWEAVMRLAMLYQDRQVPHVDMETLWSDPESRSVGELADAALKAKQFGVPWRQRMRDYGYTPQVIDRMESERATDALMAGFLGQSEAPAEPEDQEPAAA